MKKNILITFSLTLLSFIVSCSTNVEQCQADDTLIYAVVDSTHTQPIRSSLVDDILIYYTVDSVRNDREKWMKGYYTDTTIYSMRNYSYILSMYDIDSLKYVRIVEQLYPLSSAEATIFYDSLTNSQGIRKLFFLKLDTLFVRYAIDDSGSCIQKLFNMMKYLNPKNVEIDWISEYSLSIYYYVIPENLERFRSFYDTCNKDFYYGMNDWVESYNSEILDRIEKKKNVY